ncbi:hypothetical protein OG474_12900 [Kribbella sp. NBC_01505]|uniref:hypothetical protein n=1 Tax=Kribbella sp. NBC_01505 TaxID=2903580 RepID=UPI00386A887E
MNATVSRRVVLSAVATGLLATGCGSRGEKPRAGTTSPPPLPVRAAGIYVFSGSFDGQAPPAGDGVLITPHSTHSLESLALRTEVQGPEALQLGIDAFSVEPGHEIVIASFKEPGPPAYSEKAKATLVVAAGKQTHPVDLFGPYDPVGRSYREFRSQTVVACVPIGTPVELLATDAGRTVSLDLRTGKRGAGAYPLSAYNTAQARLGSDFRATSGIISRPAGRFQVDAEMYNLDFGIHYAAFGVRPWTPTRGWAPRGTTWAVLASLSVTGRTADGLGKNRDEYWSVTTVLDLASTFQLTPAGGRRLAGPPGKFKVPIISASGLDIPDLIWAVPDTFTEGVIRIQPQGSLTVEYANRRIPAAWASPPLSKDVPVAVPV